MMADSVCPRCGAALTPGATDGLCPACLLEGGFIGDSFDESTETGWGTFAPGSSVGPFEIVSVRGRGGMATVYEAHDTRLDRAVALKVLPPAFLHDMTFARRFEQEARVVAKLEHSNIVPIYARGIDDGVPWMSMRLLPGGTVGDLVKQGRPEAAHALRWLRDVASALDYAHAQGVVHRDVKPTNILLDTAGQAYVADFGLAQMLDRASELTVGGTLVGTPQYMAPEQALGSDAGPAADIYSLGIVAYELLTGSAPFTGHTPMAVLMKHVNEPLPSAPDGTCAPALVDVIRRATAKKPEERWPSPGAFVNALEHAAKVSTTPAAAVGLPSSLAQRRMNMGRGVAAVSAAALIVGAIAWFLTRQSDVQPLPQAASAAQDVPLVAAAAAPAATPRPSIAAAARSPVTPRNAATDFQAAPKPLPSIAGPSQDAALPRDAPPPPASVPGVPEENGTVGARAGPAARADIVIPPARLDTPASADVLVAPVRLTTVAAEYPAAARAAELEGDVILDAGVGADGRVTDVNVVKSVHPLLDESARRAVLRYAYRSGTRNGSPEAARIRVTVSFRIR
jgi:TonB family protein